MPKLIDMQDVGLIEFPDEATDDQILEFLNREFTAPPTATPASIPEGPAFQSVPPPQAVSTLSSRPPQTPSFIQPPSVPLQPDRFNVPQEGISIGEFADRIAPQQAAASPEEQAAAIQFLSPEQQALEAQQRRAAERERKLQQALSPEFRKDQPGSQIKIGAQQAMPQLASDLNNALSGATSTNLITVKDRKGEKTGFSLLSTLFGPMSMRLSKNPKISRLQQAFRDHTRGASELSKQVVADLETVGQSTTGPEFARTVTKTGGSVVPSLAAGGGGLPAMIAAAGLHSAGATYGEARDAYEERGMSREDAEREGLIDGLVGGTITALSVAAFGKTGVEAFANGAVTTGFKSALKELFTAAGLQAPEEMLDQTGQSIAAKLRYRPELTLGQAVKEVLLAGAAGGILGGAVNVPRTGTAMIEAGIKKGIGRINRMEEAQDEATTVQERDPDPRKQTFQLEETPREEAAPDETQARAEVVSDEQLPPDATAVADAQEKGQAPTPQAVTEPTAPDVMTRIDAVKNMGAEEFYLSFQGEGSLTRTAQALGRDATSPEQIRALQEASEAARKEILDATAKAEASPTESNLQALAQISSKEQFFNEALQAARGDTGIRTEQAKAEAAITESQDKVVATGLKTAAFIDEALQTPPPGALGIAPPAPPTRQDLPVAESELQSTDPNVEARWKAARLHRQSISTRAKAALIRAKNAFTRHFPHLDPKTDGALSNILRVHESEPLWAKYMASQALRGITSDLAPRSYEVFSKIVILRDLINYGERFLADSEALPFGYKSVNDMRQDLARYESLAERFPDIGKAVVRRDEFMNALRDDLVSRKLLPESVADFGAYFHHQVIEHMVMKDSIPASTKSSDVRTHTKGWQRRRVGSQKDFNTSYLESEFEVISQSLAQMATQDTLARIKAVADISEELKAAAERARADGQNVSWDQLIPEDYTLWQPIEGNHFYWATSLTDRALQAYFRGEGVLTEADIKTALAKGGPKEQWVIPQRLATTLDNFGPKKDHEVERFIGAGISQWKRWTLFSPMRNLTYQLNNLSGDFDIAFAVDPKIIKYAPQAAKELREFTLKGKAGTAEINALIRQGVLDSGFSVQELPDLKGQQFFRAISGESQNMIGRYWETVLDYNRWREGILRYAAYKRALERLNSGENIYWTSKKSEIDGMRSDPNVTNQELAAKLSREAIGDYGNISHAGQWMRSKLIPFYSWIEINAPRYIRLWQNLPNEGGGRGRLAGVVGKRTVGKTSALALKAGAFYILANIWNKMFFPDEDDELADTRRQFQLILGRREDGSIITIRLQGALSDALDWFGAGNVAQDVQDIAKGRKSVADQAVESLKAPVNRIVNAAIPIHKTLAEAVLGRQTYPDVFRPRIVRDRFGHIAKLFSIGTIYDYLTNKPQRKGTWSPERLVTYTTDPGEAAYYTAKSLVSEWLEENAKESPVMLPTNRSNALFYYKTAIKYKDEKAKEYWLNKYYELGGKEEGLKTSVRNSHPLHGLSKDNKSKFLDSLSPVEREIIRKSEDWFQKTYQ